MQPNNNPGSYIQGKFTGKYYTIKFQLLQFFEWKLSLQWTHEWKTRRIYFSPYLKY